MSSVRSAMGSSRSVHGVERFAPQPFRIRRAVLYHLVYHRSLAIAINHLCFLHTYLFGILLFTAAPVRAGGIFLCIAVTACLAANVIIGGVRLGVSHTALVIIPLAAAAWMAALALTTSRGDSSRSIAAAARATATWDRLLAPVENWMGTVLIAVASIAVVLLSFALQLLGHCAHEHFKAVVQPLHGLVAAPLLEFACIFVRRGVWDLGGVLAEADELRAAQVRRNTLKPRAALLEEAGMSDAGS